MGREVGTTVDESQSGIEVVDIREEYGLWISIVWHPENIPWRESSMIQDEVHTLHYSTKKLLEGKAT
jgi:hypothetical protein